ncbi:MAG: formylglycine-generating enzyme family protein [Kiritimatiellae bacterium]|nr:formylglycine-generating enzyme family protein [Kiritimatiellia bacterium]
MNNMRGKSCITVLVAMAAASLVAMPTKPELQEAEELVRGLMLQERDAMRAGTRSRADVARVAAGFAEKVESEAAKLLLLKGAFTLYVDHGAFDEAIETLAAIRILIPDIPPRNLANMIESALGGMPRSKGDPIYRILDGLKAQIRLLDEQGAAFRGGNYCVIDLSGGPSAFCYPVTCVRDPSDISEGTFNTDTYKTAKLVLRRVEPGAFMMCGTFGVTLTKPYLIGIFEVTQKQYELVMGADPSEFKGDKRPVEHISFGQIRGFSDGSKWPASPAVDPTSFLGRLRARTGLAFDLPTEAQWEYACRAGTTSAFNNGGDSDDDMKMLGRYGDTQADGRGGYSMHHTAVGSYQPNAWGLYDMHGNVWEWCLDWAGDLSGGVTDPKGPEAGAFRILRGGSWGETAQGCNATHRWRLVPNYRLRHYGFRIVLTINNDE